MENKSLRLMKIQKPKTKTLPSGKFKLVLNMSPKFGKMTKDLKNKNSREVQIGPSTCPFILKLNQAL
jgi:hypothetical protein